MRVLISAYACEPGRGSEPGAGWEWAQAAARYHEVWLLTRWNNAPAIDAELSLHPKLRINPVYIDLPARLRAWKRGRRGVRVYYLIWQLLVWRHSQSLHRDLRFDLVHHLTLATDWMPTGLEPLSRTVPLVWGPVGGVTKAPLSMVKWLGVRGICEELMRSIITSSARRVFGDRTSHLAALTVAQNQDVARRFAHNLCVVEPNVAISRNSTSIVSEGGDDRVERAGLRRACFVGRLAPLKGLRVAIDALAQKTAQGWRLEVFGDGPDRRQCEERVRRLGLTDRVDFHGQVPRQRVMEAYIRSEALIFPSLHDGAGWAIAEAMLSGCFVIALDHGGPSVVATGDGCRRITPGPRVHRRIAQVLADLPRTAPASDASSSAERLPDRLSEIYEMAHRAWHRVDNKSTTLSPNEASVSP